jgi:hypothetical protein
MPFAARRGRRTAGVGGAVVVAYGINDAWPAGTIGRTAAAGDAPNSSMRSGCALNGGTRGC